MSLRDFVKPMMGYVIRCNNSSVFPAGWQYDLSVTQQALTLKFRSSVKASSILLNFDTDRIYKNNQEQLPSYEMELVKHLRAIVRDIQTKRATITHYEKTGGRHGSI